MFHKYLRAVGFSNIETREELQSLISRSVKEADRKSYTTVGKTGDVLYGEYHTMFADRCGLCVRGEYADDNTFRYDYYFPFLEGKGVTSEEDVCIERQLEKLSYAGVVDDYNMGIAIIFYLESIITYIKYLNTDRLPLTGTTLTLSGLSEGGTILLPIKKDEEQKRQVKHENMRKARMLAKAAEGDQDAINNLTIKDMDTMGIVQKRVMQEDLYSVVDTCFMPYGIECDLYSVIGEITSYELTKNKLTGEEIYILTLDINDMIFDVCVNKADVTGEVAEGRRFKGNIWLQGRINYPDGE